MSLRAAAADLPALAGGGPCLLLLGDAALDLPGIALWRATPGDGGFVLHRADSDTPEATLPLPGLPAGLLGILAAAPEAAAPLLAAWGEAATAPPVLAPDAAGVARLLAAALDTRAAEAARLHAAMAALREETETQRGAVAALLQALGQEAAPPPSLMLAAEPSRSLRAEAGPDGLVLAQRLGCSLEGVAAIGLHVAAPGEAPLTARLIGEESGRVRAAWAVPAAALAPGWLMLDLPTPLGPERETAVLEVMADGPLALSLEDAEAPADRCPAVQDGSAAPGHALAIRLWTAAFGRRFVLSPWWDWEAQDLPPAIPQRLPEPAWAAVRVVGGPGEGMALGETGPLRPLVTLEPHAGEVLIVLPAVPVAGLELVEARLAVRLGEAEALEAALWVQPAGLEPDHPDELSLTLPGARSTGWRGADAARGGLTLALRLAQGPEAPGLVALVLALRHAGGEAGPLQVEWADALGRRLSPALPPAAPRPAAPAPSAAFLAAAPEDAAPRLDAGAEVRLMELFAMPGGGYRHLDILAEGLRLGALRWPRIRFKFAVNGGAPQIEVRSRPDWPVQFERWPGTQADEHGPFVVLSEADRGGRATGRMRSARDRRLLEALLSLLPTLVATAARAASADPAEYADWVAMARRFSQALRSEEEGGQG